MRIVRLEGKIVGRAYINNKRMEIVEFKSKNGRRYLKGIEIVND